MTPTPTRLADITAAITLLTTALITVITMLPPAIAPTAIVPSSFDPDTPQVWNPGEPWITSSGKPKPPDSTAAAYTAALWKHFAQRYPGVTPRDTTSDGHAEMPGPVTDTGWFTRESQTLDQVVPAEYIPFESYGGAVYTRTVLGLHQSIGKDNPVSPDADSYDSVMVQFDNTTHPDILDLWIIPPRTYTKDAGGALDLTACGYTLPAFKTSTCDITPAKGPNGEKLRFVTGRTKLAESEPERRAEGSEHFAVLYRIDGSAVVVRDAAYTAGHAPSLSFSELATIALALPIKPL